MKPEQISKFAKMVKEAADETDIQVDVPCLLAVIFETIPKVMKCFRTGE